MRGARLSSLAPGPHPQRELTLTLRRGVTGRGSAWPQALRHLRQRLLRILVALPDFVDRRALPAIFIFDVGGNGPAFFFEQLQHLSDGRLALAPTACCRPDAFSGL